MRGVRGSDEIGRLDPTAGPVPEHERRPGLLDGAEVDPRRPVRSVELDDAAQLERLVSGESVRAFAGYRILRVR
jgi:hypothetical protein